MQTHGVKIDIEVIAVHKNFRFHLIRKKDIKYKIYQYKKTNIRFVLCYT